MAASRPILCCRITIEQGLLFTRHRKIKTMQENYDNRQDNNLQSSTKRMGQSPLKGSLTRRGLARPTSRQSPESFTGKTKGDEHQRPSSQTQSRQDSGWTRVAIGMKCRTRMPIGTRGGVSRHFVTPSGGKRDCLK